MFCSNCGSERVGESKFCAECGRGFSTETADSPVSQEPVPRPATPSRNSDPVFENSFGVVYGDRIRFNVKKSLFGGGIEEDFPLRHVTSIRSEVTRKAIAGVLLLVFAVVLFGIGEVGILLGVIAGVAGVLFLIGWPAVTITTAGGETRMSFGSPLQHSDADDYAAHVRQELFKE